MALRYVITGAGRGIGLELTRQALERGVEVVAVVRDPAKSKELQTLAREREGLLRLVQADVTQWADVETLAREVSKSGSIDVLINNAGAFLDGEDDFRNLELNKVARSFEVNSIGPMRVTQALLPLLEKSKDPKVVHITSLMGSIADNSGGGSYGYRMSKAALNMFMKSFANDFPAITTLVIHPGWVQTDMGGSQAPVHVRDSAKGILDVIGKATRKESGRFFDYEGDELPW
jgi:NAD(P)-dependent dehydrogenase (short-subunit alcohol dehydrogenase family)